jgi:hypothetical protein
VYPLLGAVIGWASRKRLSRVSGVSLAFGKAKNRTTRRRVGPVGLQRDLAARSELHMRACLARLGGQYCQDRWVAAGLAASVVRERRNAAANRGPG